MYLLTLVKHFSGNITYFDGTFKSSFEICQFLDLRLNNLLVKNLFVNYMNTYMPDSKVSSVQMCLLFHRKGQNVNVTHFLIVHIGLILNDSKMTSNQARLQFQTKKIDLTEVESM